MDSIRRVFINDRCLYRGKTGISTYLANLLAHWPADSELQPVCFCTKLLPWRLSSRLPTSARSDAFRVSTLKQALRPGRRPFCLAPYLRGPIQKLYDRAFRASLQRHKPTVYFEPNNLPIPTRVTTVATVHDLSVLDHPQWHPPDRVRQWSVQLEQSLATTDHWIVPSQFTRDRMLDLLSLSPEQITVIALAGKSLTYPDRTEAAKKLSAAGLPSQYFLHLGNLEPRKNLRMLLDAYAALPKNLQDRYQLIFAGPFAWGPKQFWKSLSEHPAAEKVLVTGYISDAQAAVLLAGAMALVVPSSYEGFGLPILEAMACGTAVLCSTAQAFQETAAGAAKMLPPDDPQQWTAAICRLTDEPSLRETLRYAALERSKSFSWDRCLRRHLELFQSLREQ